MQGKQTAPLTKGAPFFFLPDKDGLIRVRNAPFGWFW
jgi:hypothetical protein